MCIYASTRPPNFNAAVYFQNVIHVLCLCLCIIRWIAKCGIVPKIQLVRIVIYARRSQPLEHMHCCDSALYKFNIPYIYTPHVTRHPTASSHPLMQCVVSVTKNRRRRRHRYIYDGYTNQVGFIASFFYFDTTGGMKTPQLGTFPMYLPPPHARVC